MIIAIWQRYVTGSRWWLILLAGVLLADVFIGSWLISQELRILKEAWSQ